jgi:hypothetical protein
MDIHDKSSDWGLTSGLVPVDQAFSKNRSGTPNANIHPHGHGERRQCTLAFRARSKLSMVKATSSSCRR